MIRWLSAWHWSLRTIAVIIFGVLTAGGFAPAGLWPVAILGVAGLTVVVATTRRWFAAVGYGYAYGLGLLALGVGWMQVIFVQAMIALVMIEAVFFALLGDRKSVV